MDLQKFVADGGIRSRKFLLALLCLVLLCAFVGIAAHWAGIIGMFPEFVTGVLGVLSIYCGGDVARHFATVKHLGDKLAPDAVADDKADAQ
jgi:hypothetical protein